MLKQSKITGFDGPLPNYSMLCKVSNPIRKCWESRILLISGRNGLPLTTACLLNFSIDFIVVAIPFRNSESSPKPPHSPLDMLSLLESCSPYLLTFPKVKIAGEYCLSFLRQLRRYKNPSNCTLTFLPLSSIILHDRWENYRSFTDKIFKKWFNFITQFLTTAHGTIANVKFRIPMRKFNIPTKLVKLTNIWSQIKSAESL